MFKNSIIAASLALASFGALAADYYVVVPVKKTTTTPGQGAANPTPTIAVSLNSYTLPSGMVNIPYAGFNLNSLLTVTGDSSYAGTGATWRVASGAIPAGLSLSSSGMLTGTPTVAGTGNFTLEATYKTKTGTRTYQVAVAAIDVLLASATLPSGTAGQVYSGYDFKPLLSSTAPDFDAYSATWDVSSGSLPAGITLNSATGLLSGTPSLAGNYNFTVRGTYLGAQGAQSYTIGVAMGVSLSSAVLPSAFTSVAYSHDFKSLLAVTGDASLDKSLASFSLADGSSLPAGLSLSSSGVLSGTPTTGGTSSFTVNVTYKALDAQQTYSLPVSITIADAVWDGTSIGGTRNGSPVYSNGNHTVSLPSGLNAIAASVPLPTSGKWYWEVVRDAGNYGISGMSVKPLTNYSGQQAYSCGLYMYFSTPDLVASGTGASKTAVTAVPFNTTIGQAYDAATRTLTFYLGNNKLGSCSVSGTGTLYPTASNGSSSNGNSTFTIRTVPAQMTYAPPAGYTAGLPKP